MKSKSSGVIVLFYNNSEGTIISLPKNNEFDYRIGRYDTDLDMPYFTAFEGSITLSND